MLMVLALLVGFRLLHWLLAYWMRRVALRWFPELREFDVEKRDRIFWLATHNRPTNVVAVFCLAGTVAAAMLLPRMVADVLPPALPRIISGFIVLIPVVLLAMAITTFTTREAIRAELRRMISDGSSSPA